ncbi:glutamine amidotransferase [Kaistia nematophila]|uniref:Glutamine amidotransferase n=1 Tax=Kaistia nematophila TaxID=2994654 RepID=A0A9X3E5D8_9HYPH|nr:glutamine amidotransferase [Kaistia nematophila]MCX5572156.1 glutamine amidotransferase [Kaistia nematophila]
MPKTVLALRHVQFEDLGVFAPALADAGFALTYRDAGDADFLAGDPLAPDLLVVLGGPIGVYEDGTYPFLKAERDFIARRLAARRPTLGLCLGAQLMAAALGKRVFPSGVKEIGFAPVTLTEAGAASPLRHLEGGPVLHWHGDTYELPDGAVHLASTAPCPQQAFSLGPSILALQFHPEADTGPRFERWLIGHAAELATAGIDIPALRRDAAGHGPALARRADALMREWLTQAGLAA